MKIKVCKITPNIVYVPLAVIVGKPSLPNKRLLILKAKGDARTRNKRPIRTAIIHLSKLVTPENLSQEDLTTTTSVGLQVSAIEMISNG